jgi:pilus assembly protein Flp/PilA
MLTLVRKFRRDESGQDLIEYALIAALIALAAVTTIGAVGTKINSIFTTISTSFPS